jgi:hypothetical protein
MSTCVVKQESTLPALRILLGVTEVTQVQQLTDQLNDMSRLMKAYHFQQTMKQFADACLKRVNANLAEGEMRLSLVAVKGEDRDPCEDAFTALVFVNPDLDEKSYILGEGYGGYWDGDQFYYDDDDKFFLNRLEDIAAYSDLDPENFEYILRFCHLPEDRVYLLDTPDDGTVLINLRD